MEGGDILVRLSKIKRGHWVTAKQNKPGSMAVGLPASKLSEGRRQKNICTQKFAIFAKFGMILTHFWIAFELGGGGCQIWYDNTFLNYFDLGGGWGKENDFGEHAPCGAPALHWWHWVDWELKKRGGGMAWSCNTMMSSCPKCAALMGRFFTRNP